MHRVIKGHTDRVYSLDISKDGHLLASSAFDGTGRIWDLQTGQVIILETHHWSHSTCFTPDRQLIAADAEEGSVRIWDAQTGAQLAHFKGDGLGVYSVCFTPNGRSLLSGGNEGIKQWDLTPLLDRDPGAALGISGQEGINEAHGVLKELPCIQNILGAGAFYTVVASHDGLWVISRSNRGEVQFWDIHTGKLHRATCPVWIPHVAHAIAGPRALHVF